MWPLPMPTTMRRAIKAVPPAPPSQWTPPAWAAPTFSPANGDTVIDNTTNITLTFAEAIAKSGGGDFTSSDLSNILTLKRTNAGGANIPYTATINGANTIITINPTSESARGGCVCGHLDWLL